MTAPGDPAMTTRPAAVPPEGQEEASIRRRDKEWAEAEWGTPRYVSGHPEEECWADRDVHTLLATLDHERAERAKLLDRVRRVHYPPQIGTHPPGTLYEQGFADCLRAVLAEFERPQ